MELNREQQINLLRLARKTLANKLEIKGYVEPTSFDDEIYKEKRGCFVTLHSKGNLRGCIGYIIAYKSIYETVIDMSVSAAFRDPRFEPMSEFEYENIDFEISVLSSIEIVENISEIVVGKHGIIMSNGSNQGLLLPQVPVEQGWNLDQFLTNTCYKSGMMENCWKDKDTKIEKFSAQVFSEKELGLI